MKKPIGTLRQAVMVLAALLTLSVVLLVLEAALNDWRISSWHMLAIIIGYFVIYTGIEFIGVGRGYLVDDIGSPRRD